MTTSFEVLTLRRSQVGKYTISTIDDNGILETAVYRSLKKVVVVDRYGTTSAAVAGHKRWEDYCKESPKSAYDVTYRRRLAL